MQRHPDYTRRHLALRLQRVREKLLADRSAITDLQMAGPVERLSYDQAMKLKYRPVRIGERLGPNWATHWFKLKAVVPAAWRGSPVELRWNSNSEATLWIAGRSIQGLNGKQQSPEDARFDARLLDKAKGGEVLTFAVEQACNWMFGNSSGGGTAEHGAFWLEQADLLRLDSQLWSLYHDFRVLVELEAEQLAPGNPLDPTWGGRLLFELNRFANLLDLEDRTTWPKAHAILADLYQHHNAPFTHRVTAIGHAHIDTAWLWPLAETHRKCVRTFSSQTRYMDRYPFYKFACSQAQQYAWIKERNPDLYRRIAAKVKTGQWIPVGGTWIEPDCNIPSGEALCRQFLYGQAFFAQEFGKRCNEFWNPDVFGYNGQLPQIMRQAGIKRFLTQKLSWNYFNKPHAQTFLWRGIDGSEVLAHFPPADTYNALASPKQLREQAFKYKDADRSRHALMLFGHGDGGGGPTPQMLENLARLPDLLGVPRVAIDSSDAFFDALEQDLQDPLTLVGELYFELHRGTYTTQAATKKGNRQSELLLHDVEFLAAAAGALTNGKGKTKGFPYPKAKLDQLWQLTLLNQFHDILPGSSIDLVYADAQRHYAQIAAQGGALRAAAAVALVRALCPQQSKTATPINTIGFSRREVAAVPRPDGGAALHLVEAPPYGIGRVVHCSDADAVHAKSSAKKITLENAALKAVFDAAGRIVSLTHKPTGRESLAAPGNVLELYQDDPCNWEAWEVEPQHLETAEPCPPADSCKLTLDTPLRAEITWTRKIGKCSTMTQVARLDAASPCVSFHCNIDWRESRRFLKAAFPVNVMALNATYEMPFGIVQRPTHYNNSYDLARFEVPVHKWADLSEHGFGVALLNDCKYGMSTFGNTLRLSLLRAPKSPDPNADMGPHTFAYALMPHPGSWQDAGVVAQALRFNAPMLWTPGSPPASVPGIAPDIAMLSLFSVDHPALVLDTVKRSQDGKGLVLRFYEAHGSRGRARIQLALPCQQATRCNVLEDILDNEPVQLHGNTLELPFTPYQILSVKLT
jgi:alpha-mannosidase